MANLEEKKFCTNCGAMIGTVGNFCEKCGAPMSNNGTQDMSDQPNSQSSPLPSVVNATPQPESLKISQSERATQNRGFFAEYFAELKSFNCKGRLNRARYWKYGITTGILSAVVSGVSVVVVGNIDELLGMIVGSVMGLIISILNIPFLIRRAHDLNRSGWFLLIALIPFVNFVFFIYLGFFKGTDGPNSYGPDPLQQ